MIGSVLVSIPLSWSWNNHHDHRHRHRHRRRRQKPPIFTTKTTTTHCSLTKQSLRFLSSLSTTADDPLATSHLIRKFINSSPKSVSLNALFHLLSPDSTHSHLSSLALPLYWRITEAPWFSWNPKLVADLVALLDKNGQRDTSQTLISESVSRIGLRERDLVLFYCNLMDSHSKHKSKQGFLDSYERLKQLLFNSSSVYVRRRAYESMVSGLCLLDLPHEAENLMEETTCLGLEPSTFEFRSLVYSYGRLGLFEDMKRTVAHMEGKNLGLDTVCSNMVLSSFGAEAQLSEMVSWLRRMKVSAIPFSIRTYNSVLNSCPTIMAMLGDLKIVPLSIHELTESLPSNEILLVQELIGSSVLVDSMEWNSLEAKLDLHGMHLGSAYLIMLLWIEELRSRFHEGKDVIPAEITVVCGSGKHSTIRGQSAVKGLVKEMMIRMKSPMRIDRKNVGCFVAKGRVVKAWLC